MTQAGGKGAGMTGTDDTGDPLGDWLIRQGLEGATREEVLEGYCNKLVEAGIALMRLHVAQSSFRPRCGGLGLE